MHAPKNAPTAATPFGTQAPGTVRMGEFSIRLVHFNSGWRYWAFHRETGFDVEYGLSVDGYDGLDAAIQAVQEAAARGRR